MNLPWQYIYQKIKTRFYRGLILIITDVGTEWPEWQAGLKTPNFHACVVLTLPQGKGITVSAVPLLLYDSRLGKGA